MSASKAILFGYDVSHWTSETLFSVCALGIFVCYGGYAVLQETIFRMDGFDYGLYLTFTTFCVYAFISYFLADPQEQTAKPSTPAPTATVADVELEVVGLNEGEDNAARATREAAQVALRRRKLTYFALVALCSVSTQGFSNIACQYLNYPTQVIFKCCKLLPVMLVGTFYFRKQYSALEYTAMTLLTAGLIVFSAGNVLEQAKFDSLGVIFISGALVADAVIGNVQEFVLRTFRCSTAELMFYTKFYGLIMLFMALIMTGQLLPAIGYTREHPLIYIYSTVFAVLGCIGEFFVITLIQRFGALIAVVTTSLRKMATIVLSFLLFPKAFSFAYLIGTAMVFTGIGIEVYVKNSTAILRYWQSHWASRTEFPAEHRAVV